MSSQRPWGPHCVERRHSHPDFQRFIIAFACLPNFRSTKRTLTLLVWGLWQSWLRLALQESKLRKELSANLMWSNREFLRKKKNWFCFFMDSTKHWKEKLYLRWMWISRISEDGWIIWLLWLAGQHIIWSHNFATRLDPECSKTEEVRRSCNHDSTRMLMTKLKKEKNYNLKDY